MAYLTQAHFKQMQEAAKRLPNGVYWHDGFPYRVYDLKVSHYVNADSAGWFIVKVETSSWRVPNEAEEALKKIEGPG